MHTLTLFSVVIALYTVLVHSQDVKRTDLTETGYSKDASEMQGGQSEINDYQSIDSRQLTDCQKAGEGTTCVYKIRLPGHGICCNEGVSGQYLYCPITTKAWTRVDCGNGKVRITVDAVSQQIRCAFTS